MADIAKHHTEEKRECDLSKNSRIDFLVARYTICVHDLLEHRDEVVRHEIGWWTFLRIFDL